MKDNLLLADIDNLSSLEIHKIMPNGLRKKVADATQVSGAYVTQTLKRKFVATSTKAKKKQDLIIATTRDILKQYRRDMLA